VDIETASAADIGIGAWAYSEHPSTIVHCVVFAVCRGPGADEQEFYEWVPGAPLPQPVVDAITAGCPVVAHNCLFEWSIWTNILIPQYAFPSIDDTQWLDTQARGVALNLPPTLEGLGAVLGLPIQKDTEGSKIMRAMAKATPKADGSGWTYDRDAGRLLRLIAYCRDDVAATAGAFYRLPPLHPFEAATWRADQAINRRGVYLDGEFADRCLSVVALRGAQLQGEMAEATDGAVATTTAVAALKTWVEGRGVALPVVTRRSVTGKATTSSTLDVAAIGGLLADPATPEDVRRTLDVRAESGKLTSLAKLKRVDPMAGRDGRLRGAFRYCGALTGRWASSGLQLHNLPKPGMTAGTAAELVAAIYDAAETGDLTMLELCFGSPLSAVSRSLRSVLVAGPRKDLLACDYSAIEARGVAWLAGQDDILDIFRSGQDVYVYAASRVGSKSRQLGKILTLALGYGMGAVKFQSTAAAGGTTLTLKEADTLKRQWRENNAAIVGFWYALEDAFRTSIHEPGVVQTVGRLSIVTVPGRAYLRIILPSGRSIYYFRPHTKRTKKTVRIVNDTGEIEEREFESEELRFYTVSRDKRSMEREATYGGKLCVAGDADVLTGRGWVRLADVRDDDLVHDGVDFVGHGGKVFKSTQACVCVDGVWMTPDHEVLTDEGWRPALENPRPYRPTLRDVDLHGARALRRSKSVLARAMRLRATVREEPGRRRQGHTSRRNPQLRMLDEAAHRRRKPQTRHGEVSRVLGLAVDARSVPTADSPGLAQLRREGNSCVPEMERALREFLGRYGTDVRSGPHVGSCGQQRQLRARQLSVGNAQATSAEQAAQERVVTQVYDLIDCGPRRRFVVRGNGGPFIVHNCENVTQAVARDLLAAALQRLHGTPYEVVVHVHDSVAAEVPEGTGDLAEFEALTAATPSWGDGLPIDVDGYRGKRFRG